MSFGRYLSFRRCSAGTFAQVQEEVEVETGEEAFEVGALVVRRATNPDCCRSRMGPPFRGVEDSFACVTYRMLLSSHSLKGDAGIYGRAPALVHARVVSS
jgi:hypothetical protein